MGCGNGSLSGWRGVRRTQRYPTPLHRLHEVVAGDGLAVVAREVEVHPAAEALGAQQRVLHPDQLGALLVDGGRVVISM
jgi:hypothetical protein